MILYLIPSLLFLATTMLVFYIQTLYFKLNSLNSQLERAELENQRNLERINELEERLDDLHHEILNNINNGMNIIVEENGEQAINNAAEFFQLDETNQQL